MIHLGTDISPNHLAVADGSGDSRLSIVCKGAINQDRQSRIGNNGLLFLADSTDVKPRAKDHRQEKKDRDKQNEIGPQILKHSTTSFRLSWIQVIQLFCVGREIGLEYK